MTIKPAAQTLLHVIVIVIRFLLGRSGSRRVAETPPTQ